MRRAILSALAIIGLLGVYLSVPATAVARDDDWDVDSDRSSVPQDQPTAVQLTFVPAPGKRHADSECYTVQVPSGITLLGAQIASAPAGSSWTTSVEPAAQRAIIRGGDDARIDQGQSVVLALTVRGVFL